MDTESFPFKYNSVFLMVVVLSTTTAVYTNPFNSSKYHIEPPQTYVNTLQKKLSFGMPNKAFDRACKLCILRFVIHNKHLLFSWNFPFPDTTIYSIKIVEKRGHRITRARAHTHTNTHTIAKSSYLFTLWWHRCGGSRVIVCRLFVWNVRSAISSAR